MKIVAVAKKLAHEGDHLHEGNFFVGQVKTFFAGGPSGLDAVSSLKSSLANELASAVQNKLADAVGSVVPDLPSGLLDDLQGALGSKLATAVDSSIGNRLAHGLSDLEGDALSEAAARLEGSALADPEGNPVESPEVLIAQLQGIVDSGELTTAVDDVLGRYESELGENLTAVTSACNDVLNNDALATLSDVATDAVSNLGKPLDSLLDGDLGSQLSDMMGSSLAGGFKNSLAQGGKIIIGGSNLLGSVPSLGSLGSTTILGGSGLIQGVGKKMVTLAAGKLSFAGGISLSSLGLSGGSGSSAFSLGPGGLSIGGKNLSKMLAPEPLTKSADYTLELEDAGGVVTMDSASANVLTIPPESSVAFEIGTTINIIQVGVGQTSIAPGSGVQLYSGNSHRKLARQYAKATIIKKAANQWILYGDISA